MTFRSTPTLAAIILAAVLAFGAMVAADDGPEQDPARPLRILAYNIKHGRGMDGRIDLERVARVIAKEEPDLVALQEVDRNCTRSGNQDIAAELGRRLGMDHRFGAFMAFQGGEYGMAVLSRLPITSTTRHPLPAGAEPRCALEVQVEADWLPSPLSFVSIHNDWTNETFRSNQVEALLEALKDREMPVVLAGDFNGERTDPSLQLLEKGGWKILPKDDPQARHTFPSEEPRREIDFFVVKNLPDATITHAVIDER
ncbi:MAG: endonuclease/exonuclease/phosphatase family protein, partial [Planctomycetota bacterium]